ncbi:MAG TPA: protein translocase subunit SecF [Bdellovibrionales bacterium]|nr:MAG: protein-export membrane protein SecF [Bdellovibrionales bacterium GWB1_52_6]OFZ04173.1 MAG: protein-export membrane protein SecF [Bdellovibrionales bacterium GWA1_52_35]OFZ37975.1 MAG: protein-export membrane protein SecF [Bdellovibrionales bacterium GWC1_52_8]HAR41532.1 protein translocase subunit SecF [Bdellovibrionales bacterium]HCM40517.1 protein translocase subunit SecF [Bdellovibrionales bacterium]
MFQIIRSGTQIDFVGKRHLWVGISIAMIALTVVLFFTKGLNYGIDFTGGAEVQVRTPADWDISKVRSELDKAGIKGLRVQEIGDPLAHEFLVKAQGDDTSLNQVSMQIEGALAKTLKPGEFEIQRVDVVGPAAGSSLRMSGFLSMFYALLCILIYVTIRFDYRYAPGAVIALFHDIVITLGVFIIFQKQFDLQILGALLALIGYSNNDTIIVFDRIRETTQQHPELTIEKAVNRAVNETLGRTILTSTTTFISVFALFLIGGKVIHDFAFTLLIGIVIGTYSSIFIASSLMIFMTHYQERRNKALLNPQKA